MFKTSFLVKNSHLKLTQIHKAWAHLMSILLLISKGKWRSETCTHKTRMKLGGDFLETSLHLLRYFPLPPFIGSQGPSGIRADLANICKKRKKEKKKKVKSPKLD